MVQWVRLRTPNAGGPGAVISGQGTRSHVHAATKSSHATTKQATVEIPHAATKTQNNRKEGRGGGREREKERKREREREREREKGRKEGKGKKVIKIKNNY